MSDAYVKVSSREVGSGYEAHRVVVVDSLLTTPRLYSVFATDQVIGGLFKVKIADVVMLQWNLHV